MDVGARLRMVRGQSSGCHQRELAKRASVTTAPFPWIEQNRVQSS